MHVISDSVEVVACFEVELYSGALSVRSDEWSCCLTQPGLRRLVVFAVLWSESVQIVCPASLLSCTQAEVD